MFLLTYLLTYLLMQVRSTECLAAIVSRLWRRQFQSWSWRVGRPAWETAAKASTMMTRMMRETDRESERERERKKTANCREVVWQCRGMTFWLTHGVSAVNWPTGQFFFVIRLACKKFTPAFRSTSKTSVAVVLGKFCYFGVLGGLWSSCSRDRTQLTLTQSMIGMA